MTNPILTLIKNNQKTQIFADGTVNGEFEFGLLNGAMPLLDAIACLCFDSKNPAIPEHHMQPQCQQDCVLADHILELLQCYGQRWQIREGSKG